jgi:ribonuclease E
MKKGTEKVIAHLPIECATFLLNEKRSAIEQIENRLKVGIVILPSKHLETPAYDIERIKEKETNESKPSYLQIKAEDITIPEFAQQVKPSATKAAVKEFLHDSPAPTQTKNEAASLIQRFWHKLVGTSPEPKAIAPVVHATEKVQSTEDGQPNRNRGNRPGQGQNQERGRGRGRGQGRGRNPNQEHSQVSDQVQAPKPKPEQNSDTTRPNRPPRGQGRNVRRNLDPANMPVEKVEQVTTEVAENIEVVSVERELTANDVTGEQPKRNNARRGPNRRRPRNPNYKKPETDGESSNSNESSSISNDEASPAPAPAPAPTRSYDNDFAQRVERVERPERQEPEAQISLPPQFNIEKSVPEAHKPAAIVESAPMPAPAPTPAPAPASVPAPFEAVKQESE